MTTKKLSKEDREFEALAEDTYSKCRADVNFVMKLMTSGSDAKAVRKACATALVLESRGMLPSSKERTLRIVLSREHGKNSNILEVCERLYGTLPEAPELKKASSTRRRPSPRTP